MATAWEMEVDVLVIGSGAGGLSTAITAAQQKQDVLVLEKTPYIGGSTAVSGGVVWVPDNQGMADAGMPDKPGDAMRYLEGVLGERMRNDMVSAYLEAGPQMVDFFHQTTSVRLAPRMYAPDYQSEDEGASIGGRALDPQEYDGRELGEWFARLRPPMKQLTAFDGMMVSRYDIDHLLSFWRRWSSFLHGLKILTRYGLDRLKYPRGTRLLAGNALAARLLKSSLDTGVRFETDVVVRELIQENGQVTGVIADIGGKAYRVRADKGVMLATGGFAANDELREQMAPHAHMHYSMSPAGNYGDGKNLAESVGGRLDDGNANNYFLAPVSVLEMRGEEIRFPHLILDRQKPGLIAIGKDGKRFVNEADSYHDFVEAMHRNPDTAVPAWLIADSAFLKKYGLGLARPAPFPHGHLVAAGYLIEAPTIVMLAEKLGVPARALSDEVDQMNNAAQTGSDERFGKGATEYNRYLGDLSHKPNPCLGPIERGPFYAVKVYPGDIGASRGLRTNAQAQVVDSADKPIPGLYACGNDMNSIMAGTYPAGGITLGPAMTFGYIAARHMTGTNSLPDSLASKEQEAST